MEAIAILYAEPEAVAAMLVGVDVGRRADFVLVPLGIPLASEPDEIVARLQEVAAAALELHQEPRGVPVIPSTLTLEASTWNDALSEVGELADWVQLPSFEADGGLEGLMSAFAGMAGGGAMPDMSQLASALQGESGKALLGQAMGLAQQLAADGQLSGLLQSLGGAPGMPGIAGGQAGAATDARLQAELDRAAGASPDDLVSQAQAMMQGMSLDSLADQAHGLLKNQPDLEKTLRERMAAAKGDTADDEDDRG